jgi:hypothetical protein
MYGDDLSSEWNSASDHRVGRCISLALPTFRLVLTSSSGLLSKDRECADKCILGIPCLGIRVELAEEDVYAVCLTKNVFGGFEVDDVFGVGAWLFWNWCCG